MQRPARVGNGVRLVLVVVALCLSASSAGAVRIVSLAPSLTELAYDAGAGHFLVGAAATKYTDYRDASQLPSVGDAFHVDLERVVALKPDIVLAWASAAPPKLRARLRGLGYKVALFKPRKLADIAANLRRIGKLAGTVAVADKAAAVFVQTLHRLRRDYAGREPVSVFYEIAAHPLYTISGKQIISEGIRLCGGETIFPNLDALAAPVSIGAVIKRDPQAIITAGVSTAAATKERLKAWQRWPQMKAVKNNALFSIPPNKIVRATPRMLDGIAEICRDLDRVRSG